MELLLGEDDVPYEDENGKTTVTVGEALEKRYHLLEAFYDYYSDGIAQDIQVAMEGKLEALFTGAPVEANPLAGLGARVEERFKDFITSYAAEGIGIPGTPTQAALDGVTTRKRKRTYGTRRPSFIDSGNFLAHFRAWIEE